VSLPYFYIIVTVSLPYFYIIHNHSDCAVAIPFVIVTIPA